MHMWIMFGVEFQREGPSEKVIVSKFVWIVLQILFLTIEDGSNGERLPIFKNWKIIWSIHIFKITSSQSSFLMNIMWNIISNTEKNEYIIDLHACEYKLKRIERDMNETLVIKLLFFCKYGDLSSVLSSHIKSGGYVVKLKISVFWRHGWATPVFSVAK